MFVSRSFSRHGKAKTSFALLIWLIEKVHFTQLFTATFHCSILHRKVKA